MSRPLLILIAGPYASGTDGDPARMAANLRRARVDAITLRTDADYLPALRAFFQQRERRIARR